MPAPLPLATRIGAALAKLNATSSPASYIPHKPHPRQAEFLALDCLEALYGGAAGGGKSDALLMAALQYVHVPGYSALILRRTYADLSKPGAIMDRAADWLSNTEAKWNGTDKRWSFPSGASLSFGYLDTEKDKYNYASAEFQFVAFDELTTFVEPWYRFLFSRLRKKEGMPVPLRMRAATNPGGIGHDWVKRRFLDDPSGPPFVLAKLDDNPSVDKAEYVKSLEKLDETTRKQLLEGVWIRDTSGLVYAGFSDALNVVEAAPADLHRRVVALDFGIVDQNAVAVLGWRQHERIVYVLEAYRMTGGVTEMAEEVQRLNVTYKPEQLVGDTGGMGKAFEYELRTRHRLPLIAAEKQNKVGYIALLNDALRRGEIRLVREKCQDLVHEWQTLPWAAPATERKENQQKEAEGFGNHAADATLYGWRAAFAFLERPAVVEAPVNSAEWESQARDKRAAEAKRKATAKKGLWWK